MVTNRFRLSWLRPVRIVVVAIACVMLFLSTSLPVMAAGSAPRTQPNEGETQLKKIYDESENSLESGLDSMKEVTARANRGVNEVQADADISKMSRPDNSQEAVSFKDQVKEALEKVTPGNNN